MKKLDHSYSGGNPLYNDDLAWEQAGIIEAIKGLASMSGIDTDTPFIISGCEVTFAALTYTMAPGWVFINGEVYEVEEQSLAVDTPSWHWRILTTYNADGNQTFGDGLTHNTHLIQKAGITLIADLGIYAFSDVLRLRTGWVDIANYATGFVAFDVAGYQDARYKIDRLNQQVKLNGNLKASVPGSITSDTLLFTLPAAAAPATDMTIPISPMAGNFTGKLPMVLLIKPTGDVYLRANATNSPDTTHICLDGVTFPID